MEVCDSVCSSSTHRKQLRLLLFSQDPPRDRTLKKSVNHSKYDDDIEIYKLTGHTARAPLTDCPLQFATAVREGLGQRTSTARSPNGKRLRPLSSSHTYIEHWKKIPQIPATNFLFVSCAHRHGSPSLPRRTLFACADPKIPRPPSCNQARHEAPTGQSDRLSLGTKMRK